MVACQAKCDYDRRWQGDLDQVTDAAIVIRNPADDDQSVAEIDFDADFEEEHGVGILTDGDAILGVGYALDVEPFS